MNILRRISTRALVLSLVVIVAVSAATAYAVSTRSGPKPPPRSLAAAIHGSLAGGRVTGVTARVSFTDHLFPSDSFGGSSSPLLTGATGRLWVGDGRARIELQGSNGDTEIAITTHGVTVYDVSSGTAYRLPFGRRGGASTTASPDARHAPPSLAEIRKALADAARHVSLSGAIPGNIGGRPSYSVRVSPRHDGGLLGAVRTGLGRRPHSPAEGCRVQPGRFQPGAGAGGDEHQLRPGAGVRPAGDAGPPARGS